MSIYLFDLDGTLVDSMPVYGVTMVRFLDERNIKYSDNIREIVTPLGYMGTAEYFKELGVAMPVEEIVRALKEEIKKEYENNIPAKKNVVSTLTALKNRGARLNVLSASPREFITCCLRRLGVLNLFENVWSSDDFNTKKTDPQIYKQAAQRLGVSTEEIIFLDDNYTALKTAKSAGMHVYGVYDETSKNREEDMRLLSEKYIKDFSELL